MIYTVTFNPAIDCVTQCDGFAVGTINEADGQELYAGGKGVNVSFVLAHLGRESTALGFIAGWTGAALETMLRDAGIATDFVCLPAGNTRVNFKLSGTVTGKGTEMVETTVNALGPSVDEGGLAAFMGKVAGLAEGDVLVLSGARLRSALGLRPPN